MSFEVFMSCWRHEKPAGTPTEDIRAAFSSISSDSEPDYLRLRYDTTNNCDVHVGYLANDPGQISGLVIHQPCSDSRLWESLYKVLTLGPWSPYFPSPSPPLIVADAGNAMHFPVSMKDSLRPIRQVKSGKEIVDIIRQS